MNETVEKLIKFVDPDNLKGNLICSSLYIAFFETTKDYLIEQPKDFFSTGYSSETGMILGTDYKRKVLSKDPKSALNSSLLWFAEQGAIEPQEVQLFHRLKEYRNVLAHEMLQKIYDGLDATFSEHFSELVSFRIKLERWWVLNVEIPTGIDPEVIKEEDLMTSSQILLKLILDVLSDDEVKAKFYYSEFLKYRDGNKK